MIAIILINDKLCLAGVFDLLTKTYMQSTGKDKPGVGVAVAAGITSACLAQVLSFPLETVARRLQVGQSTALLSVHNFGCFLSPHLCHMPTLLQHLPCLAVTLTVLCCTVLCCNVLCSAVLHYALPRHVVACFVVADQHCPAVLCLRLLS